MAEEEVRKWQLLKEKIEMDSKMRNLASLLGIEEEVAPNQSDFRAMPKSVSTRLNDFLPSKSPFNRRNDGMSEARYEYQTLGSLRAHSMKNIEKNNNSDFRAMPKSVSTRLNDFLPSKSPFNRRNDGMSEARYEYQTLGSLRAHSMKNIEKNNNANRKHVLPLYTKSLPNTPVLQQKSLTWKAFLRYTHDSMFNIPPKYHGALLLLCGSFIGYQTTNTTAPFDFQFKKSTPQSLLLLTFEEAFEAFFPEITHITKFVLCYFLTLMLVFPLQPGVQIFCMILLISAPLFYFPELFRKASMVGVEFGSFNLPLIWFATLGAIGLSLICGIVTMLMIYLSWRFVSKGKPRVREVDVSFDDLSEVLAG